MVLCFCRQHFHFYIQDHLMKESYTFYRKPYDEIPVLLINCDPFHSFSFPFICYFFNTAVQKCSPELCECLEKTPALEFFLKKQMLQYSWKDFIKVFFLWNLWNFSEQPFCRTTFGKCFCFRGWCTTRTPLYKRPKRITEGLGVSFLCYDQCCRSI